MRKVYGFFLIIYLSIVFFVTCTVTPRAGLQGEVSLYGEQVENATVTIWNLAEPSLRFNSLSDLQGKYVFSANLIGVWGIQVWYQNLGGLLFTAESSFTAGVTAVLDLFLDVLPQEKTPWNLVVLSFSEPMQAGEILEFFTPWEALQFTFLQKNASDEFESWYLQQGELKSFYTPATASYQTAVQNALDIALKAFPSDYTALLVLEDSHGWRNGSRQAYSADTAIDYPDNVFYDKTTSALEFDRLLEGKEMDVLLELGSYGALLESLYQVKEHFEFSVALEGVSPRRFENLGIPLKRLFEETPLDAITYSEFFYNYVTEYLHTFENALILEKNGMGCSIIEMNKLSALSLSVKRVIDQLTLLLIDAKFKENIRKDLGFTLDWQTLAFDYKDYKDLNSWLMVLKRLLNGELAGQNYRVKSKEDGFQYNSADKMVVQLLGFIELALLDIDQAVRKQNAFGFKEDFIENAKKFGYSNYSQIKGLSFWYPISVKGGLWNVFGKEKYDRLLFSADTGWADFLNRLLSIDTLPSQQLLTIDEDGSPIYENYQPKMPLSLTGATVNLGFIDRESIDKVWMVKGEEYFTEQMVRENGGEFVEDESSFRSYYPIGIQDIGKRIGARVLLKGKDEPLDFDFGTILPRIKGRFVFVTDSNGNGLLQAAAGNEVFLSLNHQFVIEAQVDNNLSFEAESISVVIKNDILELTFPLSKVYEYEGKYLLRTQVIPANLFEAKKTFETYFIYQLQEPLCETRNYTQLENWTLRFLE